MTLRLSIPVLLLLCLTTAQPAEAQTSRLYFAGYMGLNTFSDMEFQDNATPSSGNLSADNATSFGGALGIRLSSQTRFEAEISYRSGPFSHIDINGGVSRGVGGELKSTMGLLNVFYDFDVPWALQPFVGVGIGLARHEGQINGTGGLAANARDETLSLLWQAGGGLKYRINPDMAFTGGYRYLDSPDPRIGAYEIDYNSHEFRVGLEYDLPVR
ncbi:MAG: outer membrane beta-barrel protein [Alphaproteobacteria bacterium]|nr:outer membrane beta-barrel protein [Alphaproteobacteria bacterium]